MLGGPPSIPRLVVLTSHSRKTVALVVVHSRKVGCANIPQLQVSCARSPWLQDSCASGCARSQSQLRLHSSGTWWLVSEAVKKDRGIEA